MVDFTNKCRNWIEKLVHVILYDICDETLSDIGYTLEKSHITT